MTKPRIVGEPVRPLVPTTGDVLVFLVGEAPGPRGADKSGIPFFGDAAGAHLYEALSEIGAMALPSALEELPWDGSVFAAQGIAPVPCGIAIGNAFDRCPTDNGYAFRAPTRAELVSEKNIARLRNEILELSARGLKGIVTMGRVAATTIDRALKDFELPPLLRGAVVHPSARGLLSTIRGNAGSFTMAQLQARWKQQCQDAVVNAGYLRHRTVNAEENGQPSATGDVYNGSAS